MSIIRNIPIINNLNIYVPFFESIKETAKKLNAEVFFVGGCIRDAVRGQKAGDADIVPFGIDYEKFAYQLARHIKAYAIPFKDNIRLAKGALICDVSKPRGTDIYEDLSKRDFTINNLATDINGKIIGDISDIENGIIKAVYKGVFDDDPLRLLRAFRFVSTLGFVIDNDTLSLIKEKSPLLPGVASERITEELRKTFAGKFLKESASLLKETGVLKHIFPNCDLDFDSLQRLKLPSFSLQLGLLAGKNAIKPLSLSSAEEKTLLYMTDNCEETIKISEKDTREQRAFLWKHFSRAEQLFDFTQSKYPHKKTILENIFKLTNTLNTQKATLINGSILMKAGFTPSPLFAAILADVSLKLALDELDETDINTYLTTTYGDKK